MISQVHHYVAPVVQVEMPSVFIKPEDIPILRPVGPDPPQEVASIIDRFSGFVISNGKEFEQRGINAITEKTHFLLSDDPYHNYYRWCVYEKWPGKEAALEALGKTRVSRWGQQQPTQPPPPDSHQQQSYYQQPQQRSQPPPHPTQPSQSQQQQQQQQQQPYKYHQQQQQFSSASKRSQQTNDGSYYSMTSAFGSKIMTMKDQAEFTRMIDTLSPAKSSISNAREWVAERQDLASCIAECLLRSDQDAEKDFKKQLSILYLINDVLLSSCSRAFKEPFGKVLSKIFASTAKGTGENADNKTKVAEVLRAWIKREVYPYDVVVSYLSMFDSSVVPPPPPSSSSSSRLQQQPFSSVQSSKGSDRKRSRSKSRRDKRSRSKSSHKRKRESSASGSESGSGSSSSGGSSGSGNSSASSDSKGSKREKSSRKHHHHHHHRHHHHRPSKREKM